MSDLGGQIALMDRVTGPVGQGTMVDVVYGDFSKALARLWATRGEDGQVVIVIIRLSGFVCSWLKPRSLGNMVNEPGVSSACVAWLCP